jgi:hypothetical protein
MSIDVRRLGRRDSFAGNAPNLQTLRNAEFAKPFDRVTGAEVLELEHLAHFGFAFLNSTKVRRHQGN